MNKYRIGYTFTNENKKKDYGFTEYEAESPEQALEDFNQMFEYNEPLENLQLLSAKRIVEVGVELSEEDIEELKEGKTFNWEYEKGDTLICAKLYNGDYMPY